MGGVRLEGMEVTFYKSITKILTTLEPEKLAMIQEVQPETMDFWALQDMAYNLQIGDPIQQRKFEQRYRPLLEELKAQGIIGEKPMAHWSKNRVICKLEIIDPGRTIQCNPIKHVTPAMQDKFKAHIKALLDMKVIRPSTSRHRTNAFIVQSGTFVDPVTGKETKGKECMVYDYRILNENMDKDQYSLPSINTIVQRIGNAKVFSKFDLKARFHQVAMEEESIPWTAFLVPGGLYEWLVMSFGLKNAPAIFQRKMDNCFAGTEKFIAVYIDDILVLSQDLDSHAEHLLTMLNICKENGLILSPQKMKIATTEVDFLGATIGDSRIKPQPHILQKIADVPEKELMTTKGLRSWLGVINYARSYIPRCGTILGPLYSKLPAPNAYIIIESDGCMEGWGGICKWRPGKGSSKSEERVCAYVSGKFVVPKSTIDAEIFAIMETLDKLKIYYMDKEEITIRTDCQAIVSFHDKQSQNKPSRVRWVKFVTITGTGINIRFEHIKGTNNQLADKLSRLAHSIYHCQRKDPEWTLQTQEQEQVHLLIQAMEELEEMIQEEVIFPKGIKEVHNLLIMSLEQLNASSSFKELIRLPNTNQSLQPTTMSTYPRSFKGLAPSRKTRHTAYSLIQLKTWKSRSWEDKLQQWKVYSELS
ncbi:hypothetical protein DKX38_022630 [Salix brachista]|uniref:Uncharacterized protein n=1 Tax=Salix brachista TaxID=2182728 RepID=A0A5N5JZY9_9ROSI|nr:hypothetical protein DKX38_022630 [Salix brachista]